MANQGLPEGRKVLFQAEHIVLEARNRLKTGKSTEEQVWKFQLASCYRPEGWSRLLSIFGHTNPAFLTGTAKAVYGCCAAKALKPVIKRLPKGECAIVISAPS